MRKRGKEGKKERGGERKIDGEMKRRREKETKKERGRVREERKWEEE